MSMSINKYTEGKPNVVVYRTEWYGRVDSAVNVMLDPHHIYIRQRIHIWLPELSAATLPRKSAPKCSYRRCSIPVITGERKLTTLYFVKYSLRRGLRSCILTSRVRMCVVLNKLNLFIFISPLPTRKGGRLFKSRQDKPSMHGSFTKCNGALILVTTQSN